MDTQPFCDFIVTLGQFEPARISAASLFCIINKNKSQLSYLWRRDETGIEKISVFPSFLIAVQEKERGVNFPPLGYKDSSSSPFLARTLGFEETRRHNLVRGWTAHDSMGPMKEWLIERWIVVETFPSAYNKGTLWIQAELVLIPQRHNEGTLAVLTLVHWSIHIHITLYMDVWNEKNVCLSIRYFKERGF